MRPKIIQHLLGILLVSVLMAGTLVFFQSRAALRRSQQTSRIKILLDAPIQKFNDPFEQALLGDCFNLFFPGRQDTNAVLVKEFFRMKEDSFNKSMQSSYRTKQLSAATLLELFSMYLKFLVIYLVVMVLTYYGVQTLGTLRFILRQQKLQRNIERQPQPLPAALLSAAAKTIAYFVLFSPAYVIAYSIRTEFNTDSSFFMVILGVISNGLLVMYTNKFYAFLVAESRKGYVENALVKNLRSDYTLSAPQGISWRSVLLPKKRFTGHVFDHIFRNAQFQYLSTIKEQASFLITGLIIIEMALNIHGHLTYELLRQLLYKNYIFVIIIMLSIFYTVKLTEMFTDLLVYRENRRYENR
jgi:ABC-type dipeptide/oligopeptide/nickel transport system permease component